MDVDPIWQPGSVWPDKADDGYDQQAVVQIYSQNMGRGYITTVPTHGKTNPFIDCYDDEIMWAYMRDIEARLTEECSYWKRWSQEHRPIAEVSQEHEAVVEPIYEAKQLSFDFGLYNLTWERRAVYVRPHH